VGIEKGSVIYGRHSALYLLWTNGIMKRQYLGDSKDSFKWDYLDFMTRTLGFHYFQVVWIKAHTAKQRLNVFRHGLKFSAFAMFSERAGTPETW
jgi:hypothetical protein